MSLSKPISKLLQKYFEQLFISPIRTKAVTCSVIALCGNATSQFIVGNQRFNPDSFIAFGVFGLLFGGTIPHVFYTLIEKLTNNYNLGIPKLLLIERLLYTPLYQAFSLYMLTRLEGKSHDFAMNKLQKSYWPILKTNWTWLTLTTYINLAFVPPVIRVLVVNIIGYFWAVFLAFKLRQAEKKKD